MDKIYILSLYLLFSFVVLSSVKSRAQDTPAAPPAAQTPDVIQPPPDFPDYIVTPRENLNNFNLSTMSESKGIDYRDGVGTLGTTERRESNLEVNAELQRKRQERQKAKQKPEDAKKPGAAESSQAPGKPQGVQSDDESFTPGVKRGLFMWMDENGVLHATNDLGHVPIEYQMQALENSQGSLKLKKGTDNKKKKR